jgi:mannose-6-phosphate isomerase-like protein (cupin superfamily)
VAKTGDRFEMPDGSVYEVTSAAADTGGQFVEMIFTLPPRAVSPPPHVHDGLTEEYEVIEGALDVVRGGVWTTLTPGQSAAVPPATVHTFKNRTKAPVRLRNVHRPPARFEQFIEHVSRLLRARNVRGGKDPRIPLYLSMVILEYADTLAPGRARDRVALKALATLGRLLRLRTDVEPS